MTRKKNTEDLVALALSGYQPRSVSPEQWSRIWSDTDKLVVAAEAFTYADTRGLVSNLLTFLNSTSPSHEPSLEVLSSDKVEDYVRRREVVGTPAATLQQIRPRLDRLVRFYSDRTPWMQREEVRSRVQPFDSLSDEKVACIRCHSPRGAESSCGSRIQVRNPASTRRPREETGGVDLKTQETARCEETGRLSRGPRSDTGLSRLVSRYFRGNHVERVTGVEPALSASPIPHTSPWVRHAVVAHLVRRRCFDADRPPRT